MEFRVPVYIANPLPFRLVLRDEEEKWAPSIEEINNCTYNYVKLHRVSKFFDAEIAEPLPAAVGFDGSFLLPPLKSLGTVEATVDEFNRVFASILLGGIYLESVSRDDLSKGEMTEFGYYRHTHTLGARGEFYRALGNKGAGLAYSVKLVGAPTVLASELEKAYYSGAVVLKTVHNLSPSLLITSFTYFTKGQNMEALSHAWICIEQILDHMWHKVIVDKAEQSKVLKRKKFVESQQWTAAHKIEMLYQKSIISENSYGKLNLARDARNRFIHRGSSPSQESTKNALDALIDLLAVASGLNNLKFDRENLQKYLNVRPMIHGGEVVTVTDKTDFSKVTFWKEVLPIPGEKAWFGDFESYSDITLRPFDHPDFDYMRHENNVPQKS